MRRHRRWPLRLVGVLVGLSLFLTARAAEANVLCALFSYCLYEGVPFTIRVVDQTGQPLAEVHALAEWVQWGMHGVGPPLMVQEAVSGPDGVLAFPGWGPLRGSPEGLAGARDPIITLFKPGFLLSPSQGLLGRQAILNRLSKGTDERTRVRRFTDDGRTVAMEPFRGTADEWVKELDGAHRSTGADEVFLRYRVPYLNRLRRLLAEQDQLPRKYQELGQIFWDIQRQIRFLEEGTR
jgi:hypothetical protein